MPKNARKTRRLCTAKMSKYSGGAASKPPAHLMNDTTDRVYAFLVQYKTEFGGNGPTRRQIAAACCLSSTSVANHHVRKLARQGRLTIDAHGRAEFGTWREP